jgi:RND family efflux transporter MFP subunit
VVKSVHVLEGQEVKQGELLAELIDDDAKLILESANQKFNSMQKRIVAHCLGLDIVDIEIVRAKRQIETADIKMKQRQDELDRFNKLTKGTISDQQKVVAQLKLLELKSQTEELRSEIPRLEAKKMQIHAERESMESTLNELQTQVDTAKLTLERTKIASPINGTVLRLHAAPGKKRILKMDDPNSAVIVELYNPEKLQARIDVPLNEAASMRLDQIVELKSDLLPNRTFDGRVTRITGQADLQRNTLQAKVEIDNPDPRLRPDMLVRAKFYATGNGTDTDSNNSATTEQEPGRLSIFVQENAIFDDQFVWVVSTENKAELRELTLGTEIKSEHRQVLEGVKSGEQVILPPFNNLEEGTRVRINKSNLN